jgi:MmyB-like transcription regulator ligand binding domain
VTAADPEQLGGDIGQLIDLVDALHPNPAYLLGPMTRILAWNRAASVVLGSPDHLAPDRRYLLWWLMVEPGEGGVSAQREATARNTLARFRAEYARHAGEQEYEEFLAQIRDRSAQFREWWDEHEVIEAQRGTKVMQHQRLGTLRLYHAQTVPTGQPELRMAVYAPADEATRAALATLL